MSTPSHPQATRHLADAAATERAGAALAALVTPGTFIGLSGDLGAGKTTLIRGLVGALGLARGEEVSSPTYTLIQLYAVDAPCSPVAHIDLYRLEDADDLESTGYWDVVEEAGLLLVEWIERIPAAWPGPQAWSLRLDYHPDGGRLLTLQAPAPILARWG